jgi:hypothetical protein
MNRILNDTHFIQNQSLPFDWQPAIERLREEADTARAAGKTDPFAQIEAECWIDLIEAEIAAQKQLDQSRPEVAAALHELRHWRIELQLILRQLAQAEAPAFSAASASSRPAAENLARTS